MQLAKVQSKATVMRGGLDQVTPTFSLPEGYLTYAVNFEVAVTGGYSRVKGYERADGRPAPSAAAYTIVQLNGFPSAPAVGTAVNQLTSLATGVIAAYGADYLVLTKVVGTFDTSHAVNKTAGAVLIGTAVAKTYTLTAKQRAEYLNAAADIYRADITAVGSTAGVGPVLGVFNYNDILYAFRPLAAAPTTQGLWKATSSGWS